MGGTADLGAAPAREMPQLSGPFLSAAMAADPGLSDQANLDGVNQIVNRQPRRLYRQQRGYCVDAAA